MLTRSVAANIGRDLGRLTEDTGGDALGISQELDRDSLTAILLEMLFESNRENYIVFKVAEASIVSVGGELLATTGMELIAQDYQGLPEELTGRQNWNREPVVFWPKEGKAGRFLTVATPLLSGDGLVWSWVLVETEGVNSGPSILEFLGLSDVETGDEVTMDGEQTEHTKYHLEIVEPLGTTIWGVGEDETVGSGSPHYPLIQGLMATGDSGVLVHGVDIEGSEDHVIGVVPIPGSATYLVLEQDRDIALAAPDQFRRNLVLYGCIGFVIALMATWLITRRIVKPTQQLTVAAERMAHGDLLSPISVEAQDEIEILAQRLDAMRIRLRNAMQEVAAANRELETRVERRTSQLHELMGRVFNAQEEEKQRIALELHDETAQTLSAIAVALDSLSHGTGDLTREQRDTIQDARRMAAEVLQETRRLIYALRPVALEEMGLDIALRGYAEDLLQRSGVDIHMTTKGQKERLGDQLELSLYRIGQEALNNIAKHANAQNVWINMEYGDSTLSLTVQDDGIGFDPGEVDRTPSLMRGMGLEGIRERTSLVGGIATVRSTPKSGTTIRVEVPRNHHG
jgi:signal transduction histidine kinase